MLLLLAIASLLLGILLLVKGADWLVDGAADLARHAGVSDLTIGLTVVAFGTSMPELTVNIFSSATGANDIAIGNIVGSNIANILLILGIAGTITTISVAHSTVRNEIPFAILASVVLLLMANDAFFDGSAASVIGRVDGLILIAFFLVFLWYIAGMRRTDPATERANASRGIATSCLLVFLGLVLLIGGGKMTLYGAVQLALSAGLSESLVGLTVVAVGTSLPELATSVVAAMRGKADIAVGNIVGSNIFNIFWILGISAIIRPLSFSTGMNVDLAVGIAASILLFFAVHTGYVHRRLQFWRGGGSYSIERHDGIFMLLSYAAYVAYLTWRG
jgi:cation:H+ antiporter